MYKLTFLLFIKEIWSDLVICPFSAALFSLSMYLSPPAVKHWIKQFDVDFML